MRLSLLAFLLVTACSAPFRTTIVLTENDLQQKVAERFPLEKRVSIAKLALENPRVRLVEDDDRLAVDLDAAVRVGPFSYPGRVGVIGDLAFDADAKVLYLENAEVTTIDIRDLPVEYEDDVRDVATALLRTHLEATPVHRLKEGKEKMFVKSIDVDDGRLLVEVGL